MNKLTKIARYALLVSLLIFVELFVLRYYVITKLSVSWIRFTPKVIIMYILMFIYLIISIKDKFSKKIKITDETKYHLINAIGLIPINIIFIRMMFDQSIISNAKVTLYDKTELLVEGYSFIEYNAFIVILIITLLIVYRFLNVTKKSTK